LVASFLAAPNIASQKQGAKRIQLHLLKETPVIYSYFYNFIAAASPKVKGYVPDGIAVVNLRGVSIS
jgi:peptide/nickel transport system substrate-binding protein